MAANIALTAASVTVANATVRQGIAGEVISAGEFVYLKASDGKLWKAQADGTAEEAVVVGMAMNTVAAANQQITYTPTGTVTAQALVFTSMGDVLYLGSTAGRGSELGQEGVPGNDARFTILGYTTGTASFVLNILNTGVVMPSA